MSVVVIMPARDAGGTIAEALDSLIRQEWQDWRAIVVDDGSVDDTRSIALAYAERDPRLSLIDGPRRGAGAARNAGLADLREDWVLFLDADDTLSRAMLQRMMATLEANPQADAVHCGWTFTDSSGEPISTKRCSEEGADLFPLFARYCAFAIHSCVFRRTLLDRAGGFDETLASCEDFDLWQRIARLGARFVALDEYLAIYRIREGQSWFEPSHFLDNALRVVERGHAPDHRLDAGAIESSRRQGLPEEGLYAAKVHMVVCAAGLEMARGRDPRPLLDRLGKRGPPLIDENHLADALIATVPLALSRPQSAWLDLWPRVEPLLTPFLKGLQQHTGMPDLACRVARALELRIASKAQKLLDGAQPVVVLGATAALLVDVDKGDLGEPSLPGVERAVCHVNNSDTYLGCVVLPVFGGRLARATLADAVAARFAWPLLGALFSQTVYPQLAQDCLPVRRALPAEDLTSDDGLHDRIGWAVFVQELFGLPEWSVEQLYDDTFPHPDAVERSGTGARGRVELSQPLPTLCDVAGEVEIEVTLGGASMLVLKLADEAGRISAARIRAAALDRGHLELARVAAREAILNYRGDNSAPLRERLRRRADTLPEPSSCEIVAGEHGSDRLKHFAASAARDLPSSGAIIVGTPPGLAATSSTCRAELPPELAPGVARGLRPSQPAIRLGDHTEARLFTFPYLTANGSVPEQQATVQGHRYSETSALYGRHHFESLFAQGADPWAYTTPYERTKYEQTLSLLPDEARANVLELACAEGHFTAMLAPLVERLTASDISELAIARAAERCADRENITYVQLDLVQEQIVGSFDAIFCSEVLYYMGDLADLRAVAAKIAGALAPGGYLIMAHANLVVDDPDATGFEWPMPFGAKRIGEVFAAIPDLEFDCELATPLYRIQRFRKHPRRRGLLPRLGRKTRSPRRIEARHSELEPEVARQILWNGGKVAAEARSVTTHRLPILMYHAVSETGPDALARWRVSPIRFDEQMRYLRNAGFEPTSFEEWRIARERSTPLPGRRVLVTFDDIYADFEQDALAILRRYQMPATLFVPLDKVGGRADWDDWSGTALPLIDLEGLRRARDAGMQIGSHGAGHRQLAGIAPGEVADELWRSRVELEQALEIEVDALAYPSGSFDEVVERLAASCFYRHAVTTWDQASSLADRDLALSRIEVRGDESIEHFVRRIGE